MRQRILVIIYDILEKSIGVKPSEAQTLKYDLGMDSLDLVEFCINLEHELNGISIPDQKMYEFHDMSAGQIADYLVTLVKPDGKDFK